MYHREGSQCTYLSSAPLLLCLLRLFSLTIYIKPRESAPNVDAVYLCLVLTLGMAGQLRPERAEGLVGMHLTGVLFPPLAVKGAGNYYYVATTKLVGFSPMVEVENMLREEEEETRKTRDINTSTCYAVGPGSKVITVSELPNSFLT